MKKNRASFFNDQIDYAQINSNVYNQNYPNQMMPANAPMQPNLSAQSSFYAGANGQMQASNQMMMPGMMNMPESDDVESRLAKLERQIQRIDHRLTKLENQSTISTTDFDSNINDMYMV